MPPPDQRHRGSARPVNMDGERGVGEPSPEPWLPIPRFVAEIADIPGIEFDKAANSGWVCARKINEELRTKGDRASANQNRR